jgi:hypothetical protein
VNLERLLFRDDHILSYNVMLLNALDFTVDFETHITHSGMAMTGTTTFAELLSSTNDLGCFLLDMSMNKMKIESSMSIP